MEKSFTKLHDEYTTKYNDELKKTGIFFAFSNEQFEKNRTHKDISNSKYLSVGRGGYIHQNDKKKLDIFFNHTAKQLKKDFVSKIEMKDLIEYELANHECYYTGECEDAIKIVQEYYEDKSKEEIGDEVYKVYAEYLNKEEDYEM